MEAEADNPPFQAHLRNKSAKEPSTPTPMPPTQPTLEASAEPCLHELCLARRRKTIVKRGSRTSRKPHLLSPSHRRREPLYSSPLLPNLSTKTSAITATIIQNTHFSPCTHADFLPSLSP